MMKRGDGWCEVFFDAVPSFGSPQHYFHFLLGYLLPGLDAASAQRQVEGIVFQSCGPTMDPRIHEACGLLGLQSVIEPPQVAVPGGLRRGRVVTAPRWDHWLRRGRPAGSGAAGLEGDRSEQKGYGCVVAALRAIRDRLLTATAPHPEPPGTGPWLLLRRSTAPDFYRRGGPAENPGYGSGRRAIANLDELGEALTRAGLPVRMYEPGAEVLADQIRTFHQARGVIAIRGAELANLAWMVPGGRVVMFATPLRNPETYVSWNLAVEMGLEFAQVPVASHYPRIAAGPLLPWLTGQGPLDS